ncbi:MAG: hypothetical protein H3C43_05590 [Leptonema sp. (in: Bacteria)]|nr:hypothetical protein [Leptonema sp. (in: bacteria)]
MVFHNEALIQAGEPKNNFVPVARYSGYPVKKTDTVCYYPLSRLRFQPPVTQAVAETQSINHRALPLTTLFRGLDNLNEIDALKTINGYRRQSLGQFWLTYYHLALEDHHPGPKVPVISATGEVIGHTSLEFLNQVRWQGSGIGQDGKRYHFTGINGRYHLYNEDWGMGAGRGYEVYPYRTIAVNFAGFCSRLFANDSTKFADCRKGNVLGIAVFIPEVADRHIKMEDGKIHDGWFCATDTGSPNYIKEDRIDVFVGAHGGGNPYLPYNRQTNYLIEGGIKNSVQWDWRLWKTETQRIWCDFNKVPKIGETPDSNRHCLHDYHGTTPDKAVSLEVALNQKGELLRCRTGKEMKQLK